MPDIEPSQEGLSIEALLAAARVSSEVEDAGSSPRVEEAATRADDARPGGAGDPLAALRALGMVADASEEGDEPEPSAAATAPSEPFDLAAALGYRREPSEPEPTAPAADQGAQAEPEKPAAARPPRRGALQSARPSEAGQAAEPAARAGDPGREGGGRRDDPGSRAAARAGDLEIAPTGDRRAQSETAANAAQPPGEKPAVDQGAQAEPEKPAAARPPRRGALQSARPGEAGQPAEPAAQEKPRADDVRALESRTPDPQEGVAAQPAVEGSAAARPTPRRGALQSARPGEAGQSAEPAARAGDPGREGGGRRDDPGSRAAARAGDLEIAPTKDRQAQAGTTTANAQVPAQLETRQAQTGRAPRLAERAALPAAASSETPEPESPPASKSDPGRSAREARAAERRAVDKARRRRRAAAASLVVLALSLAAAAFLAFSFAGGFAKETSSGASSQAVYRYQIEAPDGTLCPALERASFGSDGLLEQSVVEAEFPSDDQARAWSEDMRRVFGDDVREASTEGSRAHVAVDLSVDSVSRSAYEALLANNAKDFQKIS